MKKSIASTSGALQVALIQTMTSAILITFLHQVLVRRNDPELLLTILLRVSPDRYAFELITELLQFSLFVPVLLFISLKLTRIVDVEFSYIMIRHHFKMKWIIKTYLNILILCFEAALTTIITLIVYVKISIDQTLAIPWYGFIALIVSIALGLAFYITFTTLIALKRPAIILMLTLVSLLSIGKILVHIAPSIARLSVVSAVFLNHLFEPASESRLILSGFEKIFKLITIDFAIISLLGILVQYRIKKIDFIGRRS